ncbi:hypothetical protein QFC22_003378 [Naganishia vaughanmartiniae]|uniref:Uncharacterized protein n=1 Tax=Naganishia vaughanmartiniae TaxID=1424756 RepID=A0ACC2X7A0_9TREE|nr:hypothetical protein QFC22_003378 [Naganishia vaughanmartiniae]
MPSTTPPLAEEQTAASTSTNATPTDQPPLPDEPAPTPTQQVIKPSRSTVVEEEEDEDAPAATATGVSKGKGKQVGQNTSAADNEDQDREEEEEEWDPSTTESKSLKDRKAAEERPAATGTDTARESAGKEGDTGGWQAIWAPAQNAYYFWNANTGAVQWENPLAPPTPGEQESTSTSAEVQPPLPDEPPLPTGAPWQGYTSSILPAGPADVTTTISTTTLPPIDPALAHLLPASQRASSSNASSSDAHLYQTAQFNARTGRFTANDYQYTVDHLAEANRAKRQEMAYFDVAEWEKEREEEHARKRQAEEEGGERPKKLTKKDMERFRAKKQEKKLRNQSWLRG